MWTILKAAPVSWEHDVRWPFDFSELVVYTSADCMYVVL